MRISRIFAKIQSDSLTSVEEINKAVRNLSQTVDELLSLQRQTEKQLASVVASLFLEIKVPRSVHSPDIDSKDIKVKIPQMKKLKDNYAIVRELYEAREAVEALETKMNMVLKDSKTPAADVELTRLKKRINDSLKEAFGFLAELAKKNMPSKLKLFVDALTSILEKSVAYDSATMYSYVYEIDGNLAYSTYVHLKGLTDEDNNLFPNMFVVATLTTGTESGLYLALLQKFTPPSEDLLVKHVKTVKESVSALNMLFELDNFTNSIGSLPVQLLMKPGSITKDLFSYGSKVQSIQVDENEVSFILNTAASKTKANADSIAAQLFKEFNSMKRNTNAKLRMAIKKLDNNYVIKFFFITADNAPMVDDSDLNFLKDRFSLDTNTVKRIAKMINTGRE